MKRKSVHRGPWSADEIAIVRGWTGTVVELAARLGRNVDSCHRVRRRLGLARKKSDLGYPAGVDAVVTALHAQGLDDVAIAAELAPRFPDRPMDRRAVGFIRERLGLPTNWTADNPRARAKRRAIIAKQMATMGLAGPTDLRTRAYARFATDMGWPAETFGVLRPRAVQILTELYQRGPMTRRELAAAIGMPWRGVRNTLSSNDPEGSYVANLQRRGLVTRLPRCLDDSQGSGKKVYRYAIATGVRRGAIAEPGRDETVLRLRPGGEEQTDEHRRAQPLRGRRAGGERDAGTPPRHRLTGCRC